MAELDSYLFCAEVRTGMHGAYDLIGVLDHIEYVTKTPHRFDVVLFWKADPGEHFSINVELRGAVGICARTTGLNVMLPDTFDGGSPRPMTSFRLNKIYFSAPGTYYVDVILDEVAIRSIPLVAVPSRKPVAG